MYNELNNIHNELSNRQYNIIIGLVLLWGFAVNAIMCTVFLSVFSSWNPTVVIIGYFVVAILGIYMNASSDNPFISFIGYNLVVLPVGVVLSISLQDYYASSIAQAFIMTTLITVLMIVVATIKPDIFESLGTTLFICLTGVIIIELIMMFAGICRPQWWDWIVALLFCAYIGFDWSEAQNNYKTLDNAVDSAVSLYLDIINLFIRILASSGNNKSSK